MKLEERINYILEVTKPKPLSKNMKIDAFPCLTCMDIDTSKTIKDIGYERTGPTPSDINIVITYYCPKCKESSMAKFKFFATEPVNKKRGYKVKLF